MIFRFIYNHAFNTVSFSFNFFEDEKSVAIGFGKDCDDAKKDLQGWYNKNSKELERYEQFQYPKEKPFMIVMKKLTNGQKIKLNECINMLENRPTGSANQITIRTIDF